MENASKALLLAGGVLIAILLLSLLTYAWGLFSKYQSSNEELKNIENVAKFNEQFAQYNRDDLKGYEIITLLNKVIDYNERYSISDSVNKTDTYSPIVMKVDMNKDGETPLQAENYLKMNLTKDGELRLFECKQYKDDETSAKKRTDSNSFINIVKKVEKAMRDSGITEEQATSVAKNINSIFLTDTEINHKIGSSSYLSSREMVLQDMINKYYSCTLLFFNLFNLNF